MIPGDGPPVENAWIVVNGTKIVYAGTPPPDAKSYARNQLSVVFMKWGSECAVTLIHDFEWQYIVRAMM